MPKIRVKITRDGFNEIRTMDLEDYLCGVVPSEIKAASCPMTAQQAQAIAARTYAMRKIEEHRKKDFDVDDTAGYQAFGARPRHPNSDLAVKSTAGEVLMNNGKLIDAVFTASNGGRTVSALKRWGNAVPYLVEKSDPYDKSPKISGHGVGLSQTGAEEMARLGSTYWSILAFYYPGTTISTLKEDKMDDLNTRLSAHFALREFYDPANYADVLKGRKAPLVRATDINKRIINLLEELRERFVDKFDATAIILTPHGGYRPDPLNELVGGASGSQHRKGNAADFRVKLPNGKYMDAATVAVWTEKWMEEMGVKGGVGMYDAGDNYIHVDTRGKNVAWYDSYSAAGCPGQGGRKCTYKQGTKGAGVVLIQRYLGVDADGKYGANTARAVKAFQRKHGLDDDGIFGPATNKAMGGILPWNI